MSDEQAALAAEIRNRLTRSTESSYFWQHHTGEDDLPEALAADLIAAGWWRYEDNFKVTLITVGPNAWVERDGQWVLVPRAPADEGEDGE